MRHENLRRGWLTRTLEVDTLVRSQ